MTTQSDELARQIEQALTGQAAQQPKGRASAEQGTPLPSTALEALNRIFLSFVQLMGVRQVEGRYPWAAGMMVGNYQEPGSGTVGTTSHEVVPANASRQGLILYNDSSTTIYWAAGHDAVLNKGHRLNPDGGVAVIGGPSGLPLTTQEINMISSAGSLTATYQEII